MALKINLYRNNNERSASYGLVFGRCKNSKPIGLEELAQHMSDHNTPYSQGVIKGVLTDMVSCIKELMLMGQPVKIGDLAIFKAAIVSKGAQDAEHYDLTKHVKCVKLTAIATGEVTRKELTQEAILEYTDLALAVRRGEAQLSTGSSGSDDDEGDDRP